MEGEGARKVLAKEKKGQGQFLLGRRSGGYKTDHLILSLGHGEGPFDRLPYW